MVNSGPIRPGAVLAGLEGGTLPAASCLAPEQIRLNLALRLWSGRMCRQGRERGGRRICSGMPPTDANADARRCHCMAMLSPGRPSAWPVPQKAAFRCAEGSGNARCTAKRQGGFLDTMAQTFQAGYLLEQSKKTSACSATERAPLPCLAAGSQEKALPKKWLQALHERRGRKKQPNSKTPRFEEAFINMGTTTQTHNENFSIIILCIKLNLLHPYC